jgi:hypothetical protein
MPISQRDVGGNSCGACAASYALEEIRNVSFTREKIGALWRNVQFGPLPFYTGWLGIQPDHTDPTKLSVKLNYLRLFATPYLAKQSMLYRLSWFIPLFQPNSIYHREGMTRLAAMGGQYQRAIGIYLANGGLHYVLTKYDQDAYWIMDSNAWNPTYVKGPTSLSNNTQFTRSVNGQDVNYQYLGACIVVTRSRI